MDPTIGILQGLAGAIIPGIGAQASAQIQRQWALDDWNRMNEYNSPKAQLQRLKDAGLPAAAFFSGGVSSQSDMPRSTQVDPTLGAAQGIQNFMQNRIQQVQMRALEADARSKEADAALKEADAQWFLTGHLDKETNILTNQRGNMLQAEQIKRAADASAAQATANIQQTIADRKDEQMTSEIDRANAATALAKQAFSNNELFLQFQRDFINGLKAGDDFWSTFRSLLSMYLLKQTR